nr:immunoglobulin light chain junction region [Macaca mulatta]
CMQALDFPWAF